MKFKFSDLRELIKPHSERFKIATIEDAFGFCKKLAISHYENFPVGSLLIPKESRVHFYSIYSFARIADDIADENSEINSETKYSLLQELEDNLQFESSEVTTPILKAVLVTCEQSSVTKDDLKRLLIAFKMDINFIQPSNFGDLNQYCHYSANPIGEMLLKLFSENSEDKVELSNYICTALQLVNFWQDISKDKKIGRYYIPTSILEKYSLDYNNFSSNPDRLNAMLKEIYSETENLFEKGKKILYLVKNKRLKFELRFIISSGLRILEKCKNLKEEIVSKRPKLTKWDTIIIIFKAFRM